MFHVIFELHSGILYKLDEAESRPSEKADPEPLEKIDPMLK